MRQKGTKRNSHARSERSKRNARAGARQQRQADRPTSRTGAALRLAGRAVAGFGVLVGLYLGVPQVASELGFNNAEPTAAHSDLTPEDHLSVVVWPTASRRTAGQENLFWKGPGDNRLWEAVKNDGWQRPFSVPGVDNIASAPTAAVNAALNQEDIYWTATDNHLWGDTWAGKWSRPYDLEMGSLGSAPSLAVWPSITRNPPGQEDLFWKGSGDNRLWEAVKNDGWQGPFSVPDVDNVASAPTAAVNAALNEEDIYWTGTDGHLWGETWAGEWSGPYELQMGSLGSAPSLAVWPGPTRPGQEDLFWKGSGDSRLWEAVKDGQWHGPQSPPGVRNVASAPTAAVYAASNEENVYWTDIHNHLWGETWAGKWSGPYELDQHGD